MSGKHKNGPMPHTKAGHLLSPLRSLVMSPRKLVSRLNLRPDSVVLELGPGPGYFSPAVARAVPRGRLVLVDVQQEMLDLARERLDKKGIVNVDYRRGAAASLPAEDGVFDVAFLVSVLGELPDRRAGLDELRRVLKPGGLLSITEHKVNDPDFIPKEELVELVIQAGFKVSAARSGLLHYTVGFLKTD